MEKLAWDQNNIYVVSVNGLQRQFCYRFTREYNSPVDVGDDTGTFVFSHNTQMSILEAHNFLEQKIQLNYSPTCVCIHGFCLVVGSPTGGIENFHIPTLKQIGFVPGTSGIIFKIGYINRHLIVCEEQGTTLSIEFQWTSSASFFFRSGTDLPF